MFNNSNSNNLSKSFYEGQTLNRKNLDKLPQEEFVYKKPKSRISISTTSSFGKNELICNNCINKGLMEEKRIQKQMEKDKNRDQDILHNMNHQKYFF